MLTLERVLARNPDHPGALHLYIHAVEASTQPGRAEAAADRLARQMPGAGHMVHMPSHIYWRVGRYTDAVTVNVAAVQADHAYFKTAQPSPIYRGLYYPHNIDFIWQSASMQGRSAETLRAAREFADNAPAEMIKQMPDMETAPVAPMVALVRFGRWDDVLALPAPPREWLYTTGVWHYARGIAYTAKGQAADAARELGGAGGRGPVGAGRAHGRVLLPGEERLADGGQRAGRRDGGQGRRHGQRRAAAARRRSPSRTPTGSPSRRRGTSPCASRWAPCCCRPAGPPTPRWSIARICAATPATAGRCYGLSQSLSAQGKTAEATQTDASSARRGRRPTS